MPARTTEFPPVLSASRAADFLCLSRDHLVKMARAGDIPGMKIGFHWRFRLEVLEKWMDERIRLSTALRKATSERSRSAMRIAA